MNCQLSAGKFAHQLVLLFGYDEHNNSLSKKLLLRDEGEALECYQAITHHVLMKKGKLRPKLSKTSLNKKSSSENFEFTGDDIFGNM